MFKPVKFTNSHMFNSDVSSRLLTTYDEYVDSQIVAAAERKPTTSFSPSAFRCDRRSWFKLRGVEPDALNKPDRVLEFAADIGSACHTILQTNLVGALGGDWIDVSEFLKHHTNLDNYTCENRDGGFETLIEISNPPVRFACDGIVRVDDTYYLLEIKSSEHSSWLDLTGPKSQHLDQVECYATLLELDHVLFMYVDRAYGGIKCYEYSITSKMKDNVRDKFRIVLDAVKSNIAPDPLPVGDLWCSPNYCPYHIKCKEYGR